MRVLLIGIMFYLGGIQSYAQHLDAVVKQQAEEVAQALLDSDLAYVIDRTYPDLVRLSGGREHLLRGLEREFVQLEKQGVSFTKVTIENPSEIVKAEDELHCILPQIIEMKVEGGTLRTKGYLLGISKDEGKQWYFLDTASINGEQMKTVLPHFNPALEIPEQGVPFFVAEE